MLLDFSPLSATNMRSVATAGSSTTSGSTQSGSAIPRPAISSFRPSALGPPSWILNPIIGKHADGPSFAHLATSSCPARASAHVICVPVPVGTATWAMRAELLPLSILILRSLEAHRLILLQPRPRPQSRLTPTHLHVVFGSWSLRPTHPVFVSCWTRRILRAMLPPLLPMRPHINIQMMWRGWFHD
jgi:hypothetical protein